MVPSCCGVMVVLFGVINVVCATGVRGVAVLVVCVARVVVVIVVVVESFVFLLCVSACWH